MNKPSWIGVTIKDRYTIEELLGQGGMSAVYKASDRNLRRVVALKMIHAHLADNQEFVSRFEEEAAAVAKLRHANIIQVYDFDHDDGTYYMVLEFVAGESLNARLKRLSQANRQLSIDEALGYLAQVCDAVEYAHRRGMVHRDIKPANIMLDVQGQAILMDFGIVKIVGGDKHTATGAVLGTALYMSPEQIKGESAGTYSDIYSLGVTLFEMLSGKPPFQADSVMTVMMMHLSDPVPDLQDLRPGVPASVVQIIEKAMAKNPSERHTSAAELAAALRNAQAQLRGVASRPETQDSATVIDDSTTVEPAGSKPPPIPDIFKPQGQPHEKPSGQATFVDANPAVGSNPFPPPAGSRAAGPASSGDTGPMQVIRPSTGSQRVISAGNRATSDSGSYAAGPATPSSGGQKAGQTLVGDGLKKAWPWALIVVGGAGFLLLALVVVVAVALSLRGSGGDGSNQALLAAQASQTAQFLALGRDELVTDHITATGTATPGPSATASQTPTATIQPSVTHTQPPTDTPTVTVPAGIPYVRINQITIDDQNRYVVEYETFEYTEVLPGVHVHFFFDTVPPEQAGSPGKGPWILYGGPRPFTDYTVSHRPAAAEQMCALVANANHSVQANSGNCFKLP